MPTYISPETAAVQQRMIAADPSISFGDRDIRNPNVIVGSPPSSSGGVSTPKTTTTTTTPKTTTTTGGGGSYGGGLPAPGYGAHKTLLPGETKSSTYIPGSYYDPSTRPTIPLFSGPTYSDTPYSTQYPGGISPLAEAGYRWGQGYFGNMTQGQGVANTNEVINRLMEAIIRQQTPTIVYPEYPQYTPPSPANLAGEPPLTWEQATQRATEMVNPLAETARTRTIQMFQEQRERLPYQLAAKGQLSQGALRNAEEALTQAQALALEQIDMQKLAQALETARQLQTTTQEQAAANLATQWQQWLAQQEANLQRAQLTATEQWRQYEARRNILAQLVAWLMQQQGLERADELAALQAALQISPFITNPLAFAQSYGYWPAAS